MKSPAARGGLGAGAPRRAPPRDERLHELLSDDISAHLTTAELPIAPEEARAALPPTALLLMRRGALSGLGALALTSTLAGTLALETLFAHRAQWYPGETWQEKAFGFVWCVWVTFGGLTLAGWGLNRAASSGFAGVARLQGVAGATPVSDPQHHYAELITLISASVYLLFGLPAHLWLVRLELTEEAQVLQRLLLTALAFYAIPLLTCRLGAGRQALRALVVGLLGEGVTLYLAWRTLL